MYSGICFVWLGLIHIVYPSVVCAGISILVLAALFIFQKKDTLRGVPEEAADVSLSFTGHGWEQMKVTNDNLRKERT